MNIHFRKVDQSDLYKFPLWYDRIGGPELFSNFIPSTFVSFEDSKDLLWFIVLDGDDEIGRIWFEKKDPEIMSYDLGIYLNRTDLLAKGIGRTVIYYAINTVLSDKNKQDLYLDVRKNNIRAIHCYKELGFETVQGGDKVTPSGIIKFQRMLLSR